MSAGHDLDPARSVRDEDTFDIAVVADRLRRYAENPSSLTGTPEVQQFSGGVSNLTYLLRYAPDAQQSRSRSDSASAPSRQQGRERPRHAPGI